VLWAETAPNGFGRGERLEYSLQIGLGNSRSCIPEFEVHPFLLGPEVDQELPALLFHGIHSVLDQVEKDLLQL